LDDSWWTKEIRVIDADAGGFGGESTETLRHIKRARFVGIVMYRISPFFIPYKTILLFNVHGY